MQSRYGLVNRAVRGAFWGARNIRFLELPLQEITARLDILVNNAAAGLVGSVEETSLEDFEGLFRVNMTGMFLVTRGAVPLIRAARGSIINICEWRGSADRRRVDLRLTC